MSRISKIPDLRVNLRAREWCKLPYPNHPKGCPNYGKRVTCPPQAPLFYDYVDTSKPLFLIAVGFNLEEHIIKMLVNHPNWSDRQLRCVLYWQGSVNKNLRHACGEFLKIHPECVVTTCPEAMGINVIETARRCGLPIVTKPTKYVYKIAIAGMLK